MACLYDLARIKISRRCNGYYLRWYYNGWHYWLFATGKVIFATQGEKYRTLGTQKLVVGSTQLTEEQTTAIRTITNTREIYIYTDAGWGVVRIESAAWQVYNNLTHGYDIEITLVVGSRAVSATGFSPAIQLPAIPPSYAYCETLLIGTQIWMCLNYDQATPGSRVYNNDEDNRTPFGGLYTHAQVMTPGFCPVGWHVPTIAEWLTLINYVGDLTDGGKLKRDGYTYWSFPNTGANNEEDFDMRSTGAYGYEFPAGITYHDIYEVALLWAQDGFVRFDYNLGTVSVNYFTVPNYYYGVRLIKDGCFFDPVVATAATTEGNTNFYANWNVCVGATGYFLDVSTDPAFGSFVPGFNNLSVGNVLTYNVTGLSPGVTYYYRLRAEGGGCSTSTSSNVISQTTPGAMLVTARGTGTGVAILIVKVAAGCTITLDGTAKFYSDVAGTLNESSSWTPTPGSLQTRYVRCPSGTANLLFNNVTLLQSLGHASSPSSGNPGWTYNVLVPAQFANTPRLTANNIIYFPNCTDIALSDQTLNYITVALGDLSAGLVSTYLYPYGTVTGTTADVPATCTILGLNFTSNLISGNVSALPAGLLQCSVGTGNTITGDVADLPPSMTYLNLTGSNTLSGDVADLPATMYQMYIVGNNTITGDVADFPASLVICDIYGANTVSGNITDVLDTVTRLVLGGSNTLTGDIVNFPTGMTYFVITGSNTLSGGFTGLPNGLIYFEVGGNNTISGDLADLPPNISRVWITGANTVNGSIASLPASVTTLNIGGSNVISGTLANIPTNCFQFVLAGLNTISGDVGDMTETTYYFLLTGLNTVSDYTGKPWTKPGYYFYLIPTGVGGLSSAEIDQLLIDMDTDCAFSGSVSKTIVVQGTNGAPTATSLAARTSLIAKGVTLLTN